MLVGELVSNDVMALQSYIIVNGVERAHESWSISRDIVGDLPEQVAAGGGVKQATGSIVWATEDDVTDMSPNPWNASAGWLPKPGDAVTIWAGDGATWWQQFVGVIDAPTGDVGSSSQSSIIDYTDRLNKGVEHSTVFRQHPPTIEGSNLMGVGMGPAYVIDRVLRTCGFRCTPQLESGAVVSVPGQTSLWPEIGVMTNAGAIPFNYRTVWGWVSGGIEASYKPNVALARSAPVQITARVAAEHAGTATIDAVYGSDIVQLQVTPSRGVVARLNGAAVATLADMGAETIVTLLVKSGVWTIKTPTATASGSLAIPAGSNLTGVDLDGDGESRVAGFQVSSPPPDWEFAAIGHADGYFLESLGLSGTMSVLRSYSRRKAIDVLDEISKATLAPFWFDEAGRLQLISTDVLLAREPVQTLTTMDDITKLSWQNGLLSVRSKVSLNYQEPTINRSQFSNITMWQGSGETLESGQVANFIAAEPADEDWAEVDNFAIGGAGGGPTFNQGRGTWVNSYLEDADGVQTSSVGYATWTGISSIGMEAKKVAVTAGTLPVGKSLVIGYQDDVAFAERFRGTGAPIFRGRGKAVWTDMSVSSAITGPEGFPELVHDAGPWLSQEGSTILQDRIVDFIAEQVTTPKPTITGMEVIYDPRRQLGDVIIISSPTYMGVELTALIVGVRNSAGDSFTQSLDVRIINSASTFTTYGEHEAAYPDTLTYEQWRLLYPDTTTFDGFNNDPLRGAS